MPSAGIVSLSLPESAADDGSAAVQIGDDRYRSLFATIDEGLCVLEVEYSGDGNIADLRFREVNEAFERQSGMREVLGKPLSRFLPDFARQRAGAIARVLETGGPLRLENFHADTGRWYRVQYLRIGGERSRLLAAVFEDVTERKFAERTANRLAAIVDSSDDAIISKDLDGIIQTWNAGAERIFGYRAEEAIGRPVTMLMPPDRVDEEPGILARIRRGERIDHYETVRQRKDGTLLDISLSVSPIFDREGRVVAASKIARDITEHRRLDAILRAAEERQRFLLELSDALRAEEEEPAIGAACVRRLGEFLGADRCCLLCLSREEERASLGPEFHGADMPALFGDGAEARLSKFPYCMRHLEAGPLVVSDVANDARFSPAERDAIGALRGMKAFVAAPLRASRGNPVRTLVIGSAAPRAWSREDLRLVEEVAERTRNAIERERGETALRASETRLAAELEAARQLQKVSTQLIREREPQILYHRLLDAALRLLHADFASIQSLDPGSGELRLLAQRGFIPGAAEFWMRVGPDGASTCAQALRSGRRVVVGDVEAEVSVAGSPDLELYRRTGIRALQSTPLVARGGRLLGMLSTHWGEPHRPSEDELDLFDVLARQAADFLERLEAHETLHASEARLRAIFDGTYEYIVLLNSEGRVLDANRAALDSGPWTREDLIGRPYPETPWFAGTPGAAEELRKALARAAAGEFVRYELAIARPAGEVLTFDFSLHPVSEEPGAAAFIVAESRDISRRKQTEEHRQLLVNELNHRVKNTLATVQSLAIQTLAGSQLATEVAKTFEGRLLALAQTHNLLTSARWGDVGLRELLARELAPFGEDGDGRLAIAGDDALLRPKAALALGMALHELATNATKYGAWSAGGRVRIDSALLDGGRGLRLEWKESGGPEVAKPHRRGFGTRLIQAGLTHELAGEVRIDYLPGGLHCAIEIPLASASGEAAEAQTRP